jgi:hypothetical protein
MKIQKELVCPFFEHFYLKVLRTSNGEWFKIVTEMEEQITPPPKTVLLLRSIPSNNLELFMDGS